MKISVVTLFPSMFEGIIDNSILKRAIEKKVLEITFVNIRSFGIGRHKIVDDKPYGGGAGMVLRVDVIKKALDNAKCKKKSCKELVILLDPQGKTYKQNLAKRLTKFNHLILLCGHYEGVDERIRKYIDEEISIGDYILTGGEIPAMIIIDSVVRLLPGALGKDISSENETFQIQENLGKQVLEYPQYTRPDVFEESKVPKILKSGDHKKIADWRQKEAVKKTKQKRPDLLV